MSIAQKSKYVFLAFLLNAVTYFLIQSLNSTHFNFLLPLDGKIPFIPEFIWLYHTLMPVLFITTIFLVQTRKIFFHVIWTWILAIIILDIFYVIAPSFYPRQEFLVDGLSTYFVDLTRQFDGANNTFPSSHVTFSWLLFWAAYYSPVFAKPYKILYALWATGISISTLALKQHYIVDVVSGFILATLCFHGIGYIIQKYPKIKKQMVENPPSACSAPEIQLAE